MLWSKLLIPTLKEVPQDAEIPSHQLMLRAGLIRKLASGLYTFLPLGMRSLRKVMNIIREEMDSANGQEVLMPALQPAEIWKETGRYEALEDVMFKISDRQGREQVLGPTHEEVITSLVANELSSYRDLPSNFYQIQTKFRDEIRPRFGLMRSREFIMKDAYSFDADWEGVDVSYRAMYGAYQRIFDRCGLKTCIVEADSGAMGGKDSHEFMVPAEAGEDVLLEADNGRYAANLEKACGTSSFPRTFDESDSAIKEISTPKASSIEEVSALLKVPAHQFIKTLIYVVDEKPVAILVPGNREVNELKLARVLESTALELASPELVAKATGAPMGFAGPVGLTISVIADLSLKGYSGAITGANKADTHLLHVDLERDTQVERFEDVAFALEGDTAPDGEGVLKARRGIEVGHVFKLGTKYSEALNATYLDANGKQQTMIMGCYGIGVTRTLQAVLEQSHDDNGIIWPITVAPFEVEIIPLNVKSDLCRTTAERLHAELEAQGVDVLLDDRDERMGFKFKDADLLGIPVRLIVGDRSIAKGLVEYGLRTQDEKLEVPLDDAVQTIMDVVAREKERLSGASHV